MSDAAQEAGANAVEMQNVTIYKPVDNKAKIDAINNANENRVVDNDPMRIAFEASVKEMEAKEKGRDEKGRFLPKDGKPEETANADAKDEPAVADGNDDGDGAVAEKGDAAEAKPDAKPEKAAAPAPDTLDAATVAKATVAKAARLGLDDEEIEGYSNAELKAVVKALEKRKATETVDKKATTSEQVAAELSKKDELPGLDEKETAKYDKMVEDGWDEAVVSELREAALDRKQNKFLREQASRQPEPQKATVKPMSTDEIAREHAEIDKWFDQNGEKYGKGSASELASNPETKHFAEARVAAYKAAEAYAAGLQAAGQPMLSKAELLEIGHVIANRKTIHKDAARQVSKTIQEAKKNKVVARPDGANAQTKKSKPSFRDVFEEEFARLGIEG